MNPATEGLSTEDIRKYFQRICEEAEGLMREYDPRLILEWTDTNLIEGACFQVDVRIQKDGAHGGSLAMTLTKQDILQIGGLFGAVAGKGAVADYSLDMNLREVVTHGTEAATVKVSWHEHLVVQAPENPEASAESRGRLIAEAEVDCVHLVVREEGHLALGMALCSGTVRLTMSD